MSESKKSNKQNKPSSSVDNLLDVLSIIVAGKKRVRSRASSISSATSVDSDMRRKKARQSVVTEFYCPLSGELLVDPVVADDDYLYERAEIERHIDANRADLKSPKNGKRMGTLLLPASQNVLNSIRHLVESGEVDKVTGDVWKQRRIAVEATAKAEEGDVESMCLLSTLFAKGGAGIKKDLEKSYSWACRASEAKSPTGQALAGFMLLHGAGVKRNNVRGLDLLVKGALAGSALATFKLGLYYYEGSFGLPIDTLEATGLLRRIVKNECKVNDISIDAKKQAKDMLTELENSFESICPAAAPRTTMLQMAHAEEKKSDEDFYQKERKQGGKANEEFFM